MNEDLIYGAETVSMFCRLNINIKKDLPIRSSEMGLLILVCKSEDPVTPVKAADFFKVKKPMITAMVANLIHHSYLEKIPSMKDKRSFSLHPTAKARLLVDHTFNEYIKTMELLKQKLGNDKYITLMSLLDQSNAILLEDKNNG